MQRRGSNSEQGPGLGGPTRGARVVHRLAIRIGGRSWGHVRQVICGSYEGREEVEGCQGGGWDRSKGNARRGLGRNNMTCAIKPTLMHRIPSELRS